MVRATLGLRIAALAEKLEPTHGHQSSLGRPENSISNKESSKQSSSIFVVEEHLHIGFTKGASAEGRSILRIVSNLERCVQC